MIFRLNDKLVGLRKRFVLTTVPEILQFEVTDCGACCLSMILAFFGRWESMDYLRGLCGANRDGVSAGAITRAASSLGLNVKGFGVEAKDLCELPMPQILFWNYNHFVVLEKIVDDMVFIVDPADGRQEIRFSELEQSYSGVTLCFSKNENFKTSDTQTSAWQEVLKSSKGVMNTVAIIALLNFGIAILMTLVPAITSIFIDYILIKKGVTEWRLWFLIGIAVFGVVIGPLVMLQRFGVLALQTRLALSLAVKIVTHINKIPLEYFARRYSGEVGGRVMLADPVATSTSNSLVGILAASMQILVIGAVMFSYSFYLTSIVFVSLICYALFFHWVSNKLARMSLKIARDQGKYEAQLIQSISLIEHSLASGVGDMLLLRILDHYVALINSEQSNAPYLAILKTVTIALTGILLAIITGLSAAQIISGDFTVGIFFAFNAMALLLLNPFNQLIISFVHIGQMSGNFDRVKDLMLVNVDETQPDLSNQFSNYSICIENLSFQYGHEKVLFDINLKVDQGQFFGVVGSVGSGKSTLLYLLSRVMKPTAGLITIGGDSIENYHQDVWCQGVCVVPHTNQIFEGTIIDNITLWDTNFSDADVVEACQLCMIHDEITARPGAYYGKLSEGGSDLSGGQRQRIMLARALVRKPKVLILDESTSALDATAESAIIDNLRNTQLTLIFATHRTHNLKAADHIIVLESGRIAESGTHDALVDLKGLYFNFFSAQEKSLS